MPGLGIYLLPNLVTTASLCSGFFAAIYVLSKDFNMAAQLIFLSAVLDAADGRIARITRTESRFGGEYDSLSDVIVFGCVPALFVFQWLIGSGIGENIKEIYYAASLFYVVTVCLRLARFSVGKEHKVFLGLPCPAAAVLVASLVMVMERMDYHSDLYVGVVVATVFICGACMVSNLSYYSFKQVDIRQRVRLGVLAIGVGVLIFVIRDLVPIVFLLSALYLLSSPSLYCWRSLRRYWVDRSHRRKFN